MKSIPKGNWSNTALRNAFGEKHGSIVNDRTKDGKDVSFVGNRFQRKFRTNNPLKELPVQQEPEKYHGNRIEAKKKMNFIGKIMKFIAQMFTKKAA
jgi:hypothetical protein